MIDIRPIIESDWDDTWSIIEPVFRAGESYAYPLETTKHEAYEIWVDAPSACYVALDENNQIAGTYYLKPNQPGSGSHVCNCGYIVSEKMRGKGIARKMCEHSQSEALSKGFAAMQFNLVVATNESAIHLWQTLGFEIVGTLPGAFKHPRHGTVDAHVMYKKLDR